MDLLRYAQKPKIQNLLSRFNEKCSICGRKRRFSYLESYTDGDFQCKECKSRLRLLSIPLPIAMVQIAKYFKMSSEELKNAIKNNETLKRAMLSFLAGIGRYGIRTPQVMGAPFFVIVSVTQKCNLKCSFCYNDEYIVKNGLVEMNTDFVKNIIDQLSDAGCLGIGFNGGEPTLRKDIFEIISYASSKNLIPLIATNGYDIGQEKAKNMREAGLCYAQVSLDGKDDTHDDMRGVKGSYDKAIIGIKHLVDNGVYVSVAMLATKKNWKETNHVLDIAKKIGASKFEIIDYQPIGKGKKDIDLDPNERDLLSKELCKMWKEVIKNNDKISILYKNPSFSRIIKEEFSEVKNISFFGATYPEEAMKLFKYSQRLTNGIFNVQDPFSPIATCCEAGLYGLYIDIDGTITPCPYMPLSIGNIKENSVSEVWSNSTVLNDLRDKNNLKDECLICDNKIYCGGCRARAYNLTGDFLASDSLCSRVSSKEK